MPNKNKLIFLLLQISTISVFIGRAWQHLTKGGPYRSFFLNDNTGRHLMEWYWGMDWISILKSVEVSQSLRFLGEGMGYVFISFAVLTLFIKVLPRSLSIIILWTGAFFLAFIAFCLFIDKNWSWGQLFEYAAQVSSPILLYFYAFRSIKSSRFLLFLKIAVAITFICHGLYAIGYYPQPGRFIDMVINGLGVNQSMAKQILYVAGILDIIISIGLFFPQKWILLPSVIYALLWGLATTIARLWTNYYPALWEASLKQWTPEVLFRFPHWILPLIILLMVMKFSKAQKQKDTLVTLKK